VAYYVQLKFSLAIERAGSHIAICDIIRIVTYKGSAIFSNRKTALALAWTQLYVRVDRLSSVDIHKDRGDVLMNVELEGTKCKTLFTFDHDIAEAVNI
jgi:hypothetical protein